MTTINLNVSTDTPYHARWTAWDWPEVTADAVTIWRGSAGDPRRDVIMVLSGAHPDEIADWLEALGLAIRRKALRRDPDTPDNARRQEVDPGRSLDV